MSAAHPSHGSATKGKFASLDILRGLAIVFVLFHHLPPELHAPYGIVAMAGGRGVDLFFALSGFLIGYTTLLRAQKYAFERRSQVLSFIILRAGRILPMYGFILLFYAAGLFSLWSPVTEIVRNHWIPYLTFTANYFFQPSLELGVLWSLSIEEQFYIFVALSLGVVGASIKRLHWYSVATLITALLVANGYRLYLGHQLQLGLIDPGLHTVRFFFASPARIDQLALGLFVGLNFPMLSTHAKACWSKLPSQLWNFAKLAVFAAVIWALLYIPYTLPIWPLLLGLVFVSAILLLSSLDDLLPAPPTHISRVLSFIGKVSFSLYLLHPPVRTLLEHYLPQRVTTAPYLFLGVWLLTAVAVSTVTYYAIEKPCIKWSKQLQSFLIGRRQRPQPELQIAGN
ncbi:O-acetyltransferase OatA [compost metagenome]